MLTINVGDVVKRNDIINKYLGEIQLKLERFQINIEKEYRKYNKNNPQN